MPNTMIMMAAASIVASILCTAAQAAPLPAEMPLQLAASPSADKIDDAAAAAALRAFIASHRPMALAGTDTGSHR